MRRSHALVVFPVLALTLGSAAALLKEVPKSEPNQVVEVAPGIYFRHGDLEGHGHCNNGIVVFDDFTFVVDGNFPSGAEACIADAKKLSDKPIRFVFNTHHHGDHAYGNPVWVKNGVVPIAHEGVVREMERVEPRRWRDSMNRADVKATGLDAPVPPRITYPDHMVVDDGKMRVELLHFGHAHTRGDGFAYLPKQKVLFTGDAVVNGPYNFMGDGNTESWLEVIDALRELDVDRIVPGHGPVGDKSLLDDQYEFIASLRSGVKEGLRGGKTQAQIVEALELPEKVKRYKGTFFPQQVAKVCAELEGLEMPRELELMGLAEGPPTKGEGWIAPRKIVYAGDRAYFDDLVHAAPEGLAIVPAPADPAALLEEVSDADAVIGRITPEVIKAGKNLRWVHSISAGVEPYIGTGDEKAPGIEALVRSEIILTNGKRCYGPNIADQVFAYLLNFTRQMRISVAGKASLKASPPGGKSNDSWRRADPGESQEIELRGKTMVIVGLGGIGSEVAKRAKAFDMRVIGVDPKVKAPISGVDSIRRPGELLEVLKGADVLVIACPLTKETRGMIGETQLAALKKGAYLINVARGRIVDPAALADAVQSGKLAGVGLDVTDPEPLPDSSPLWQLDNVIITPHNAGQSDGSRRRVQLLVRENIRRFAAGEPLLNVVDKGEGY